MQKTINITNIQLLSDLAPALNEIKDIKMKGGLTVRVVKTMNNIFAALREYDTLRKSALEKYAKKDENGRFVTEVKNGESVYVFPSEEDQKNAGEAAMEIASDEVELIIYSMSEDEVESIDSVSAETIGRLIKWGYIETKDQVTKTKELKELINETVK